MTRTSEEAVASPPKAVGASMRRRQSSSSSSALRVDATVALANQRDHDQNRDHDGDDDDRDDKSWRTKAESASALRSPVSACASARLDAPRSRKRQGFWRNVVRQFRFTNEREREQLIALTRGVDWMHMAMLPHKFMERHRAIYFLIATPDYHRSSTIQRDVTRTFSIFERSQLVTRDVGAQQRALFRVLNALAEAEDGYCQGMNFIAALFLVEGLDEADAYALFVYLLRKRHLARIYQRSSTFLDDYLHHFEQMFKTELPDLFQHLQVQGFVIPMYGIEWFTTLFSLSTKMDLACAIFDLFFIGVKDIFLRMGLAILKLLEAQLMCMTFEDFLRDFKPLVRHIDPYQAVLMALSFPANSQVPQEDTTAFISRAHHQQAAQHAFTPPQSFDLHRTLPPDLADAIRKGDYAAVLAIWLEITALSTTLNQCRVLANEILHFATWYGQTAIALFALERCGADSNDADDSGLTPLHFSVIRNQPDMVRLLLCFGADESLPGGRWSGTQYGLAPLETAKHWKFRDTYAARLVLEKEVCLCCNKRFDTFTFAKETCKRCVFSYCRRQHAMCIWRHQCPAHFLGRRNEGANAFDLSSFESDAGSDTLDTDTGKVPYRDAEMTGSANVLHRSGNCPPMQMSSDGGASSRRSSQSTSGSVSEGSSFVYINSPASDLPSDPSLASERRASGSAHSSEQSLNPGLLGSIVGWFGGLATSADSGSSNNTQVAVVKGVEFPDRPEWYCNASHCHSVFAYFSQGQECARCGGFFCAADFVAKAKNCQTCATQQMSTPLP